MANRSEPKHGAAACRWRRIRKTLTIPEKKTGIMRVSLSPRCGGRSGRRMGTVLPGDSVMSAVRSTRGADSWVGCFPRAVVVAESRTEHYNVINDIIMSIINPPCPFSSRGDGARSHLPGLGGGTYCMWHDPIRDPGHEWTNGLPFIGRPYAPRQGRRTVD